MFIVTDDLEIINFNYYQNLRIEGEDPGEAQLVFVANTVFEKERGGPQTHLPKSINYSS